MKRQNLIILGVFLLMIVGFYLVSCNQEDKDDEVVVVFEEDESEYINVYIFGQVYRSGEYMIPNSWTVGELFDYAKIKSNADISSFDLNGSLEDGMTYYIPEIKIDNVSFDEKVNINTATLEELIELDGVGVWIATNIISYRQSCPFTSIEEVKNVNGIGDKIYEKIKNSITIR